MATEYTLSDREFNCIRGLVRDHSGISLSDAKRQLVYSRLAKRLRNLSLDSFGEYCEMLKSGHEDEIINFTNAITTNLTSFFRENHHFEYLTSTVLPELMKARAASRRIRIWSAGCSTGEEPYSIAITVKENVPSDWDVKILATDLDSNVVQTASNGVYAKERVEGMHKQRLHHWFWRGKGANADKVRVVPELQDIITFRQLNLMHDWPMQHQVDVIFCRNVVIYFDKPTQKVLFERYAGQLADDGYLFVGHSESLFKVTDKFHLVGNTIYRKA